MPGLHRIHEPTTTYKECGKWWNSTKSWNELLVYKRHTRDNDSYIWLEDEQEQYLILKINLTSIRKCHGFIEDGNGKAMPKAARSLLWPIQHNCECNVM